MSDISDDECVQVVESYEAVLSAPKVPIPNNKQKRDVDSENFNQFKAPRPDSKMDQMAKKR